MARKLVVKQLAIELCCEIYQLTRDFPSHEKYGLASQMQRSAVSVPSNIAEGAHRGSSKDFLRFLFIARGSLAELETQLQIAQRLNYITQYENTLLSRTYCLLNALIRSIKARTESVANVPTAQRTNNE